jgi:hypothetical protein
LRYMIARQNRSNGRYPFAETYGCYKVISNTGSYSVSTVKYKHNYI